MMWHLLGSVVNTHVFLHLEKKIVDELCHTVRWHLSHPISCPYHHFTCSYLKKNVCTLGLKYTWVMHIRMCWMIFLWPHRFYIWSLFFWFLHVQQHKEQKKLADMISRSGHVVICNYALSQSRHWLHSSWIVVPITEKYVNSSCKKQENKQQYTEWSIQTDIYWSCLTHLLAGEYLIKFIYLHL